MEEIFIVTGNDHKWNEINNKLSKKINHIKFKRKILKLDEIQGSEKEIIKHKAIQAFKKLKKPCIIEDVSFGFKELNYFPGPYIKHFMKKVDTSNFYKLFKNKKARATCTIALIKSLNNIQIFQGQVYGNIVKKRKDNGFDFDRIFVPEGHNLAYSEMNIEQKNKISHRSKALNKLIKKLNHSNL